MMEFLWIFGSVFGLLAVVGCLILATVTAFEHDRPVLAYFFITLGLSFLGALMVWNDIQTNRRILEKKEQVER